MPQRSVSVRLFGLGPCLRQRLLMVGTLRCCPSAAGRLQVARRPLVRRTDSHRQRPKIDSATSRPDPGSAAADSQLAQPAPDLAVGLVPGAVLLCSVGFAEWFAGSDLPTFAVQTYFVALAVRPITKETP